MVSAGNVCGRDDFHQGFIIGYPIHTKAFAEIGVQIDIQGLLLSGAGSRRR